MILWSKYIYNEGIVTHGRNLSSNVSINGTALAASGFPLADSGNLASSEVLLHQIPDIDDGTYTINIGNESTTVNITRSYNAATLTNNTIDGGLLENITISGTLTITNSSILKNVTVINRSGVGIYLDNCDNVTFIDCDIMGNTPVNGAGELKNISFFRCKFENPYGVFGEGPQQMVSEHGLVMYSKFENMNNAFGSLGNTSSRHGMLFFGNDANALGINQWSSGSRGFYLDGDLTIASGYVSRHGIATTTRITDNSLITDGEVTDNLTYVRNVPNFVLGDIYVGQGSLLSSNRQKQIQIGDGVTYTTFAHNQITYSHIGISLRGGNHNVSIIGNIFKNCDIPVEIYDNNGTSTLTSSNNKAIDCYYENFIWHRNSLEEPTLSGQVNIF